VGEKLIADRWIRQTKFDVGIIYGIGVAAGARCRRCYDGISRCARRSRRVAVWRTRGRIRRERERETQLLGKLMSLGKNHVARYESSLVHLAFGTTSAARSTEFAINLDPRIISLKRTIVLASRRQSHRRIIGSVAESECRETRCDS